MADSKNFATESEKEFSSRMMDVAYSGIMCLGIAMGKETGLFELMIAMESPKTSQEIADAGQLKERYVREWLGAMVTAHIVNYDPTRKTYWISKHCHSITQFTGLAMCTPTLSTAFFDVADCFKKSGPSGVPYSRYAKFDSFADQIDGPLIQKELVDEFIPSIPELQKKLESGIKVLDIGCGPGFATIEMAKRFPKSEIYGLDLHSEDGIKKAQAKAKAAGLTNATFICTDVSSLPSDWTAEFSYGFANMIIHHLDDPSRVLKEILRVLKPGGALSVLEPNENSKLEDKIVDNCEYSSLMYTISMMNWVPTSLSMEEDESCPSETVLGQEKAKALLEASGYHVSSINKALGGSLHFCALNHHEMYMQYNLIF